jgi:hypothetical protein
LACKTANRGMAPRMQPSETNVNEIIDNLVKNYAAGEFFLERDDGLEASQTG